MQRGTYRIIPVKAKTHTVFALVSPEDYKRLAQFKWFLHDGYARRKLPRKIRGPQLGVLMHREVLGLERGDRRQADHINRDRLDNRRANLRAVTGQENACNVASRPGTSRFRGVSWYAVTGKWKAQARFKGQHHYMGYFMIEADAAAAVNEFWRSRGHAAPNDV
jgi:hypothetical protein